MSSIWTVCYTQPSRYNWMLQYYLRAEGLALSWIGTGRLIFSLNYTDADFAAVADRFVAAAKAMQRGRLVVEQPRDHQQDDQADRLEGNDRCTGCFLRTGAGSISRAGPAAICDQLVRGSSGSSSSSSQ